MSDQTPTISQTALQPRGEKTNLTDAERGWIFHRERKQPTPDPNEPAINQIKFYLDRYKIKEALQIFFDENTLKLLRIESDFMWDIIPLICKRLRGLCQYRFRVFEGCERMLCRIAVDENCNPKEVLISLLAEIGQQNDCDDDNVFRAMIRPLEGTLLRMNHPSPREENLRWVLNVLMKHINDIELPQEYNLEGKKRLALPNDPSVKRFIEVLPLMLNFIEEFNDRPLDHFDKTAMPILTESQIEEVFNGELVDDDDLMTDQTLCRTDSLDASITTLLGIMFKPLAFLDLTTYCADLRSFGNRYLSTLLKLRPNMFSPIYKRICHKFNSQDYYSAINNNEDYSCSETTVSLATCSYIYRCERSSSFDTVQFFPQVITHEYLLLCHLPYIVSLLERSEILVHEKGLLLLENFFKQIQNDSLDQKFLDMFEKSSLSKQLFQVMVFSPLCTNRRRAYEMFTSLCDLLTFDCKLKLFKSVVCQTELRPCVRAACIDQYRKHLTNVYRELMSLHQQLTSLAQVPETNKSNSSSSNIVRKPSLESPRAAQIRLKTNSNENNCGHNMQLEQVIKQNKNLNLESSASGEMPSAQSINAAMMARMKYLHFRYKALGGSVLVEFLELCMKACLPDSQHTDIIENYELLLATLTMFRFLKLRHTIFKDETEEEYLSGKKLKKIFFDPIRKAIGLIMNELMLHHKEIVDGHKLKNTKITQSSILNVSQSRNEIDLLSRILGPKLDDIIDPKEAGVLFNEQDEADCLNWALCRIDLVESVLVRTCDLYNC